jgi:DNA-binding GntR family transcriptional regulator
MAGRRDVSPAAYGRLRDLVVAGRLAPGSPLIEADLSKRLGVSRTPIRAALQRLRQEGFVAGSPVGQTLRPIVAPLTDEDLGEVFLMAGAFEATAARTSAGLDAERRDSLVSALTLATDGLEGAYRTHPPELRAAAGLHARFHRLIADACAGPRLRGELDVLYPQADRYARAYDPALRAIDETLAEHRAIVEAVRAGDREAAGQSVATHWRQWAARLRPVIAAVGEQGTW